MNYVPEQLLEQIESYKRQGKYEEALKLVNSILIKDPKNEDALLQVADIEYLKGELGKAEKPVDFLLSVKGDKDSMSLYVKGVLEMEKTNWSEAKKYFRKALELSDNDNPEVVRCYGLCEYWAGNREKGIQFLEDAFKLNSLDAEIIYNLVELNLLDHRYSISQKFVEYYKKNYKNLETFGKDISYYDDKLKMFDEYLKTLS